MLCRLIKEQSTPDVGIEKYDGNPLNFNYFGSMFHEIIEKKFDDPQGRLTQLIKYTCGEARELIKNCINDRSDVRYTNAMHLVKKQYGDLPQIIGILQKGNKAADVQNQTWRYKSFQRLFNFLIKCQTRNYGTSKNPLDSPDVICMILSKAPCCLQDRWNRNAFRIRRTETREPEWLDLTNFIEDKIIHVNDPLFSNEYVGQYDKKTPKTSEISEAPED